MSPFMRCPPWFVPPISFLVFLPTEEYFIDEFFTACDLKVSLHIAKILQKFEHCTLLWSKFHSSIFLLLCHFRSKTWIYWCLLCVFYLIIVHNSQFSIFFQKLVHSDTFICLLFGDFLDVDYVAPSRLYLYFHDHVAFAHPLYINKGAALRFFWEFWSHFLIFSGMVCPFVIIFLLRIVAALARLHDHIYIFMG